MEIHRVNARRRPAIVMAVRSCLSHFRPEAPAAIDPEPLQRRPTEGNFAFIEEYCRGDTGNFKFQVYLCGIGQWCAVCEKLSDCDHVVIQQGELTAMFEQRIAVIVVEDELLIRMDIAESLQDAGFEVFEAGNAAEAIKILNANTHIHAMFTDVDMPGSMDGLKLAALVRDRWPPIKIIITSGHRQVADEMLPDPGQFFAKPYNSQSVISSIRELVAHA